MKCEVCGEEGRFFTETYDPITKHNRTVWLCEMHQVDMFRRIEGALSDMRTMLKYETGYVRGILAFPDISDESKEKVREQILNSDEGKIPTIPTEYETRIDYSYHTTTTRGEKDDKIHDN